MTPEAVAGLTDALVALFDPLVQAIEDIDYADALLKDLGYQAPSGIQFLNDFSPLLSALINLADRADDLLRGDTEPDYLALFRSLINAIHDIIKLIRDIGTTLQTNFPADFLVATSIAEQFPRQLADYLLVQMIEQRYPVLHSSLLVVGIIDEAEVTTAATPFNVPYMKRVIRWEKVTDYLGAPLASMQTAYGWGTDEFDYGVLIRNILRFGLSTGFFCSSVNPKPDSLQALNSGADVVTGDNADSLVILKFPLLPVAAAPIGFEVYPVLGPARDKAAGLGLGLYFDPSGGLNYPITDALDLGVKYTGTGPLDAGIVILPDEPLQIVNNMFGGSGPQADLSTFIPEFTHKDTGQKKLLFDTAFGAKLEFTSWALRAGVFHALSGVYIEADFKGATLTIGGGQGDGFLKEILPAESMAVDFDLSVGFSSKTGLYFGGSANLDVTLPAQIQFGPLTVQAITVALRPTNGQIPLALGADLSLSIGPLEVVVQNVGAAAVMSLPANRDGNAGPMQVDLNFQPPKGMGIKLDAVAATGGGFLAFDAQKAEYAGALDVSMSGVAVKAYGLVQTRLPGGLPGYSFVVVLSTEFSPAVELPFGFSLNGVGGLLGVHRTVAEQAVQTALWAHHLDGLLFPADPVASAPQLISALDSYFPPAPDRYVLGPLARIGWGDGLAVADVALLVELPEPLKLLLIGDVHVGVPSAEPVLVLHISFDGGIDFGKSVAFFDATLHDSKIESYPISGDLAFRYAWGDAPVLALAIGGFNPQFQPPAGFPLLKRLAITVNSSVARLEAQGYLALTSNTLQFGARAELTAGTGGFSVHGWLGFDALCERDPFAFAFDLSAGVNLRAGTDVLASVHLSGHISGPSPWHIAGQASLSLLFFDVTVHFDNTWGSTAVATPAPDPLPVVIAALADRSGWSTVLPPTVRTIVPAAGSATDAGEAVLLDPAGSLRIAQRVAPLGQPITRFGGTSLGRTLQLSIDALSVLGTAIGQPAATTEEFAPAQFLDLPDADKLSLPSFSRFNAGVEVGSDAVNVGSGPRTRAVLTPLAYDTTIVNSPTVHRPGTQYVPSGTALLAMNGSAQPAQPGLRRYAPASGTAPLVTLAPDRWVIAGTAALELHADIESDGSKLGARLALQQYLAANLAQAGQLQVVLAEEAA